MIKSSKQDQPVFGLGNSNPKIKKLFVIDKENKEKSHIRREDVIPF